MKHAWNEGRTVHYASLMALFLQKTYRDYINLVQKVFPGKFLGYVLKAREIWKGDILVANIEELEQRDASEIYARRLNAKEVSTPMKGGNFIFPVADGTVKVSGGDQDLTTSTLIRDIPDRGEKQIIFEENQKGLLQLHVKTHRGMMAKDYFWFFSVDFLTVITWNPESNCTCRLKNHSPIPLKYIDVTRATNTSLDVMLERISTIIGISMGQEICLILGHLPSFIFSSTKSALLDGGFPTGKPSVNSKSAARQQHAHVRWLSCLCFLGKS